MSVLNFPSSPSTGDLYTFNEYTYRYDGEKWTTLSLGNVATLRQDLANPDKGAAMVGFIQSGAEAVARTSQNKMRETVSVKDFGAVGDGQHDDLPAFQAAVDYLWANGGGELFVPKPDVEYRWKSYDSEEMACLVIPQPDKNIYSDPICIKGGGNLVTITVDLTDNPVGLHAAILLKGSSRYVKIENIKVQGGVSHNTPHVDYVIHGAEDYHANLTIRDCQFYIAKEDCVRLATFVTVLDKLQTAYSKRGIVVDGPNGSECTSITLNSCYALNHSHFGYWFGQTTYTTFNSCAADNIINYSSDGVEAYPYYINIARGVVLSGCGAESSSRILKVSTAQGLVVNGLMTLYIGKVPEGEDGPNNLIRINSGTNSTFSGIHNQNPLPFNYVLSLGTSWGSESVTVLDASISSEQCEWVSNWNNDYPIRFIWEDFTTKTRDITVTNEDDIENAIRPTLGRERMHDLIIRLPAGDLTLTKKIYLGDRRTRGSGGIRFIGHSSGTSRIVTTGAGGFSKGGWDQFHIHRIYVSIENATLHMLGTAGITLLNTQLSLKNAKITGDNQYRQYLNQRASEIILDNQSSINATQVGNGKVSFDYTATTPPGGTSKLPVGTVFRASNPNATRIGWINTSSDGTVWLPIGALE